MELELSPTTPSSGTRGELAVPMSGARGNRLSWGDTATRGCSPVVCELNSDREVAHMQYEKQQKLHQLPAGAAVLEADAKLICRLFSPRLL